MNKNSYKKSAVQNLISETLNGACIFDLMVSLLEHWHRWW